MVALVATVLMASLLGSVHCAGMCGPLVSFYAGSGAARWTGHLGYNLGRLLVYAGLGAVAGTLGRGIDVAGAHAGVLRAAALVSGLLMVGWGLVTLGRWAGLRLPTWRGPRLGHGFVAGVMTRLRQRSPVLRAVALGLCTALLPCGWLYGFGVTAAGTGSALGGMAVMGVFWIGTLPMLVGVGQVMARATGSLRRHLPGVCALLVVLVGVTGLVHRVQVSGVAAVAAQGAPGAHGSCHDSGR